MPRRDSTETLTRRERQIMDIVYRRGRATVAEILGDIPDPPSYSAVRALVRILEEKGNLRHSQDGPRYVYRATVGLEKARASAVRRLVDTFFGGSAADAVASMLDVSRDELSDAELARLEALVAKSREEGR